MKKIYLIFLLLLINVLKVFPDDVNQYARPLETGIFPLPLTIRCNFEVEMLLEEYKGRKAGYDSVNKKNMNEFERHEVFCGQDGDNTTYNVISIGKPISSLYKLKVYGTKNTQYWVDIGGMNEIMESNDVTLYGMILKDEVQEIEILYSAMAGEKTTATRIFTLDDYEKEVEKIFKSDSKGLKQVRKEVNKSIKAAKQYQGKDNQKYIEQIDNIARLLEKARKEYLVKSGKPVDLVAVQSFPMYSEQEWYENNILKFDILISNAQELVKQIK